MKNLITGGSGMVGNAFRDYLPNAIYLSSADCDLRNEQLTKEYFQSVSPDIVIHLAAKVGGVKANTDFMGDFYRDNIQINTNVLESSKIVGVKKLVSVLSTCVYPDKIEYPLKEEKIHDGEPHFTNFAYAYAKRMLDVQSRAYRQQYGCNFITAIPNNLFGEYDNFDLDNSHVIPALIRKVWEAKLYNKPLEVWGDGEVYREFTYSDDIAKIILFLTKKYDSPVPINIGNIKEYKLKDVIVKICKILDYDGEVFWDTSKPKGQIRKPSSNAKLLDLGWREEDYTDFDEGLKRTCKWFIKNYPNLKGI